MADAQTADVRCATCGAELPVEGRPCAACAPEGAAEAAGPATEERALAEAVERLECDLEDPECSRASLWIRAGAAVVYAAVCAGCVYGSISFFESDVSSWTDWIFGAMALGLAFIAVVGIKESLVPSDWKVE